MLVDGRRDVAVSIKTAAVQGTVVSDVFLIKIKMMKMKMMMLMMMKMMMMKMMMMMMMAEDDQFQARSNVGFAANMFKLV